MAQFKTVTDKYGNENYYSIITSTKWSKPEWVKLGNKKTEGYALAMHRHEIVQEKEEKIKKEGISYAWSWLKDEGGKTTVVLTTIGDIARDWLELVQTNYPHGETLQKYRVSLNSLYRILKKNDNTPIREINTRTIEDYKKHYATYRRHKGINSDLRTLKVFCNWCVEEGKLKEKPRFVMFKEEYEKPRYINEKKWNMIIQLDSLSDWWKDLFSLYHSTGMRLGEPIHGTIDGNILIVPARYNKTRRELEIPLTDAQVETVKSIHLARDQHLAKGSLIKTFKNKFSKKFKDVLVELGIYQRYYTHFHCLRNTYAVMRWYETGDIHLVCKELNHTSIKMTEKYADFQPHRLKQDFPSIKGRKN